MLSELTESIVNEMDKLRVEAQQRESEADKLVKDTIAALKMWDEKTVELVSQLQQARDEHVCNACKHAANEINITIVYYHLSHHCNQGVNSLLQYLQRLRIVYFQ